MKLPFFGKKGQIGVSTGMVIAVIMGAVVLGLLLTNLNSSITLTGTSNTTYYQLQSIAWVVMLLSGVAGLAYVGKWIISIFS